MSEQALPIAVRAEELARGAHKRLDGINGSIDWMDRKVDVIDSKLDSVLITLATQAGAEGVRSGQVCSSRSGSG